MIKTEKSFWKFLLICSPESGINTLCFPAKVGIFLLIISPRLVSGFTLPLSRLVVGVPSYGLRCSEGGGVLRDNCLLRLVSTLGVDRPVFLLSAYFTSFLNNK
jgi:hypothetical protein